MSNTEQKFDKSAGEVWQERFDQARLAWEAGDFLTADELFSEFMELSTPWLLAIARRKLPRGQADLLPEDFVAQAYLELWKIVDAGTPVHAVKGLVGTILRRRIADSLRGGEHKVLQRVGDDYWEHRAEGLPAEEEGPEEIVDSRETARYTSNVILSALPVQERDVLIARRIDELSVAETATLLGLTEDQVKKRLQAALKRVHQIVEERRLSNDIDHS